MRWKWNLAHELGIDSKTLLNRVRAWWDCFEDKPFKWESYLKWRKISQELYDRLLVEI